jgi:DNA-binding GntR family transcriptional regulator
MATESKRNKINCLEDLRKRILTEQLQPGAYLDETEISEAYGMSRPPLRELLRQLAGEGYLILHENRGAQVAPMTHKTLRNFFIAAPMVYAAIGRLAAENATPSQLMRLKDAQLLFRAAIRDGDTEQRTLTNERFHSIMGEMADNEFLLPSLRRLLIDHARIGMIFYNTRRPELADQRAIAVEQHDQFISLIEVCDAEGCAELAIAHWELSRAQIESFVTPETFFVPLGRVPNTMR